jgi:hypothetical protein
MRYLLLLIITSSPLFAQYKELLEAPTTPFDTTYLKIGYSKIEFAAWTKSINGWNETGIRTNHHDTTTWTYQYDLSSQIHAKERNYYARYVYYFKNGKCNRVEIFPNESATIESYLTDNYPILTSEIKDGKQITRFKADGYKLSLVKITKDTGWEKKVEYQLNALSLDYK